MKVALESVSQARQYIESKLSERQVNKVLHSFPSPRFWRDKTATTRDARGPRPLDDDPTPPASAAGEGAGGEHARTSELYVGLPFCLTTDPAHCGYCLFPTEDYRNVNQLDLYLDYLDKEGAVMADRWVDLSPSSIFIGGGTPNLLKRHQYPRMLGSIRRYIPKLKAGTPITLEGIPQLFNREKLEILKGEGVTRISMGAQQLDEDLSKLSGRSQKPKHVFQAVEWAAEFGMGCNVDLIFGWPQQTLENLRTDLQHLVDSGVEHITHYELNVGGATNFALKRRDELPSAERVREMYHAGRELLTSQGYEQLTPYDFLKPEPGAGGSQFVYEECRRHFAVHDAWGWGYAAISDLPDARGESGWTFMNFRNLKQYYEALDAGRAPTECAYRRSPKDMRLSLLFRNLQSLHVDREGYRQRFGTDALEEFAVIWEALRDLDLVTIDEGGIHLTVEGSYRVPLIQTTLMQARVEEIIDGYLATQPQPAGEGIPA